MDVRYVNMDPLMGRASYVVTDVRQMNAQGLEFLNTNALGCPLAKTCDSSKGCSAASESMLSCPSGPLASPVRVINKSWPRHGEIEGDDFLLSLCEGGAYNRDLRVHLLALGDVGGTMLTGLRLLGAPTIGTVGIYDVNEKNLIRWEFEANQIARAFDTQPMPRVEIIDKDDLFKCDVFIFAASKGIPAVGSDVKDVRMAQLEGNKSIVEIYARLAREAHFKGLFCVVSDPVDNLCAHAYKSSNISGCEDVTDVSAYDWMGLRAEQIQGFGLGVMNARALYYASKDDRFSVYPIEGRAFGPHGKDLVIADSILHYDDALSRELTQKVVNANMDLRSAGFKPYVAPAMSSAALSIIATLRGEWHYGSVFIGGVYMGVKNRYTALGQETELIPMAPELYERILHAAEGLRE